MKDKLLFLSEYIPITEKIRLLDISKRDAKNRLYSVASVSLTKRDEPDLCDKVTRYYDEINNYDREIELLTKRAENIINSINSVDNKIYREIMINHFILGKEVSPVLLARAIKEVKVFGYDDTPNEKARRMFTEHFSRKR